MKHLALALSAFAVAPAAAATAPLEIVPGKESVSRIGDFRPDRNAGPARATAVFGEPSLRRGNDTACTIRWNDLGLKIVFADLGGGDDACTQGKAQTFRATGSFRTWRGLRIGARRAAVERRHPAAVRHARSYWLKTATSPFGDGGRFAVVKASLRGGAVVAFSGRIGAAGE